MIAVGQRFKRGSGDERDVSSIAGLALAVLVHLDQERPNSGPSFFRSHHTLLRHHARDIRYRTVPVDQRHDEREGSRRDGLGLECIQ